MDQTSIHTIFFFHGSSVQYSCTDGRSAESKWKKMKSVLWLNGEGRKKMSTLFFPPSPPSLHLFSHSLTQFYYFSLPLSLSLSIHRSIEWISGSFLHPVMDDMYNSSSSKVWVHQPALTRFNTLSPPFYDSLSLSLSLFLSLFPCNMNPLLKVWVREPRKKPLSFPFRYQDMFMSLSSNFLVKPSRPSGQEWKGNEKKGVSWQPENEIVRERRKGERGKGRRGKRKKGEKWVGEGKEFFPSPNQCPPGLEVTLLSEKASFSYRLYPFNGHSFLSLPVLNSLSLSLSISLSPLPPFFQEKKEEVFSKATALLCQLFKVTLTWFFLPSSFIILLLSFFFFLNWTSVPAVTNRDESLFQCLFSQAKNRIWKLFKLLHKRFCKKRKKGNFFKKNGWFSFYFLSILSFDTLNYSSLPLFSSSSFSSSLPPPYSFSSSSFLALFLFGRKCLPENFWGRKKPWGWEENCIHIHYLFFLEAFSSLSSPSFSLSLPFSLSPSYRKLQLGFGNEGFIEGSKSPFP